MGWYSRYIFPRLMHLGMQGQKTSQYREESLHRAAGNVLEIGFGSGLNLPCYSSAVESVTAVDANPGMESLARKQIADTTIPVSYRTADAAALPFGAESFDTVVSTWTLCSIANVEKALGEIHRVLKPGGQYLFIEHGRSPHPKVRKWQDRFTPVNRIIADGCHLNRPIRMLVEALPWSVSEIREFYGRQGPRCADYLYQGRAVR